MAIHFYKTSTPRTRRKFLFDFDFNPNRRKTVIMFVNNKRRFEEFESGDFNQYQTNLVIWLVKVILDRKGHLLLQDLQNILDSVKVFSQEDLELISKNWCFLRKLGDDSLKNSKCCLTQLYDARDLDRDAVELALTMKIYIEVRLSYQPDDYRFEIIDNLENVFTRRSKEEILSDDMSTVSGFFQGLGRELNEIEELISEVTGKSGLELFLWEMEAKNVLKIKKYYESSTLGYDECQFCNSCREQESDRKISKYVPCIKSAAKLESFWAVRFRRKFYTQLLDFLSEMDDYFEE